MIDIVHKTKDSKVQNLIILIHGFMGSKETWIHKDNSGPFIDALLADDIIKDNFDLTPKGIIKKLDLLRPIYKKTACYGHFGRTEREFSWEKLDKVETLKKKCK